MVVNEDITLEETIGRLLKEKNKTVSVAESCTGGYISHLITSIDGASAYFLGSVISYDNSIKQDVLHVKNDTLNKFGAVSEETVNEMVNGVRGLMKTDYSIAVSGIMGPGGGSEDKAVGTVWIGVCDKEKTNYH